MKIFLSSVIRGLEAYRDAAARAARALRHEVKRAEDFAASSATPQQACLAGVRCRPRMRSIGRRANAVRFSSSSNEARHTNPPSRSF
jgi:hypothetical protein